MTFHEQEEVFLNVNAADASLKDEAIGTGEVVESQRSDKRKLQDEQADKDKQADKKVSYFISSFVIQLLKMETCLFSSNLVHASWF